jgi:uracil-DNA glycosylase
VATVGTLALAFFTASKSGLHCFHCFIRQFHHALELAGKSGAGPPHGETPNAQEACTNEWQLTIQNLLLWARRFLLLLGARRFEAA